MTQPPTPRGPRATADTLQLGLAALQRAASELRVPLSLATYQAWRNQQQPRPPHGQTIARMCDGWLAACQRAGVEAAGHPVVHWTLDDQITALRTAAAALPGSPISPGAYRAWRAAHPGEQPSLDGYAAREWLELCRQAGVCGQVRVSHRDGAAPGPAGQRFAGDRHPLDTEP